jgi:hypothetical protein
MQRKRQGLGGLLTQGDGWAFKTDVAVHVGLVGCNFRAHQFSQLKLGPILARDLTLHTCQGADAGAKPLTELV